jgi:hypothetical protein
MDVHKLAKVLAMAASDNEAEALHALRTATRLLDNAGLDFVSLAERLSDSTRTASGGRLDELEDAVFDLRNEIRHLRGENERLRQGPAAGSPPNLAAATQDAAQAIRLRAELDAARDELARAGADGQARDLALRADLAQAIDVAERLTRQFEMAKGRADRLEAENRRLSLMAAALKAELDERLADSLHPLPSPTQRPDSIVRPEPMARPEPPPRRASPSPAARRGKVPPAGLYAVL